MNRTSKPPEERRGEIVAAARKLFLENGFGAVPVSRILRSIGVSQGTFYYYFPTKEAALDAAHDNWPAELILDQEVSEVVVADLDGDGVDELVTIEPFHGNRLFVYRETAGSWTRIFEHLLQYGHGVCAGVVAGKKVLVVGNRSGNRDLEILVPSTGDSLTLNRHVVAEGVGAANVALLDYAGESWIIATNQADSEVAVYRIDDLQEEDD